MPGKFLDGMYTELCLKLLRLGGIDMCEICGQYPCHSRCPNAGEDVPVLNCTNCGIEMYEGDEYFPIDDKELCEDCFEEYAKNKFRFIAERTSLSDVEI